MNELINNTLTVAIAGRPNVGKSTLFNLLSEGGKAVVHASSGVTRDVRDAPARIGELKFTLLDTAGLESSPDALEETFNEKALKAWAKADVIMFMLDGSAGIVPADEAVAEHLRKLNKPVIVVINKCDIKDAEDTGYEIPRLGLGEAVELAAAHSKGLDDLEIRLTEYFAEFAESSSEYDEDKPMPLAIVGRPNAGKSTLINALLKDDRMVTGDVAGLTRESIGTLWEWEGKQIELVDTPGIRKRARVVEKLEQMSVSDAMQAVERAEAVILLLDATTWDPNRIDSGPLEKQDAIIAAHVLDQGKPMLIVLNKIDAVADKKECVEWAKGQLEKQLAQVKELPLVTISASKGKNLGGILPQIIRLHEKWHKRFGTAVLNRFLEALVEEKNPPITKGRRLKLKFMSQVGERPPTFAIWCNMPEAIPASYVRFFKNRLTKAFGLEGIVVRVMAKGGDNPFNRGKGKKFGSVREKAKR